MTEQAASLLPLKPPNQNEWTSLIELANLVELADEHRGIAAPQPARH